MTEDNKFENQKSTPRTSESAFSAAELFAQYSPSVVQFKNYGHIRGIFSRSLSIAEPAKFLRDDLDLIRSERAKSGGALTKTIRIP